MKKCNVCGEKIGKENQQICKLCIDFFKWKYGKDFKKRLEQHKKYRKRDVNFSLIKFRRKK